MESAKHCVCIVRKFSRLAGVVAAVVLMTGVVLNLPVYAGVVAQNNAVPFEMDQGGTSGDMATYLLGSSGAVTRIFIDGTSDGFVFVGRNQSYNALAILNGSKLQNQNGYIGVNETSNNNRVSIFGHGSIWENSASLTVGSSGWGNELFVEQRATVTSGSGFIGVNPTGSYNSVTVRGFGSTWTNTSEIRVGGQGMGNLLNVEGGGAINTATFNVGWGVNNAVHYGDHNSVVVRGSGSSITTSSHSTVGVYGSGNSMRIEEGGAVTASGGLTIGAGSESIDSRENFVAVEGSGSTLTIAKGLTIGAYGRGNRLTVENGGVVVNTGSAEFVTIGSMWTSGDNSVLVRGDGSEWKIEGSFILGDSGYNNSLTIQSGGAVITSGSSVIGGGWNSSASHNNIVTVSGSGAKWTTLGLLTVGHGFDAHLNSLVIEDGAAVTSGSSLIGAIGGNNSATVRGFGSRWTNTKELQVGGRGSANLLTVENGGAIEAAILNVGLGSSDAANFGNGNSVVVQGFGSTITASGHSTVGAYGNENSMDIRGGAEVKANGGFTIGLGSDSINAKDNVVSVSGVNSTWSIAEGLTVGAYSTGNKLAIEQGGTVANTGSTGTVTIGSMVTSSSNSVSVNDNGSKWTIGGNLIIGDAGHKNSLTIQNGGAVTTSGSSVIGAALSGSNNSVTVSGSGAKWINLGMLTVGNLGYKNSVVIEDGAFVSSVGAMIGYSGKGNSIIVSGSGAVWRNTGNLTIGGSNNADNMLMISDNALVTLSGGFDFSSYRDGFGNYLRLDGGYFAWHGDRISEVSNLLAGGFIQIWNGNQWVNAAGETQFSYSFFETDQTAFDFSGYENLGGYTILAAIPEPGAWALLSGAAFVMAPLLSRRKRALGERRCCT